ncbi:hypothetical protein SteCoe_15590 [Stentor coeruleus]|uniref:DOMON domain-containing protein n=1 Tax=Stentor coeruleus TaxID=5963 RepID=A0A1R2C3B3_9CILI|nr:hypothetical protein SteCoe_15590 [Stentor coeruleus]
MFLILLALTSTMPIASAGGVEYLAFGLEFHWSFSQNPDEEVVDVTFEYWVPTEYTLRFGWVGVAIQDALDPVDDFRADFYIALTSDGLMTDRYSTYNGYSELDTDQGCTNDVESWMDIVYDYTVYYWKRKLITGDSCDVDLVSQKPYLVKYALGPVKDGVIEKHSMKYMGYEYFILSEIYQDNNSDERGQYGPWYSIVV